MMRKQLLERDAIAATSTMLIAGDRANLSHGIKVNISRSQLGFIP